MRYLSLVLALTACENPIEHFTEEPRHEREYIFIPMYPKEPACPVDSLAEPQPPGMPDTSACGRARP